MPTRNHMTHRATIERGTVVTDGLGLDGPRTWTTHIASLACRWYAKDETEILDGRKVLILGDTVFSYRLARTSSRLIG